MPSSAKKLTSQASATFVWTHTMKAVQCLLGQSKDRDNLTVLGQYMAVLDGQIAFVVRHLQVDSFQYQEYTYAKTLKPAHSVTGK